MRTLISSITVATLAVVMMICIAPQRVSADGWLGLRSKVYPNPFTDGTTFQLTMPNPGVIEIAVFDVIGRHMRTLFPKAQHEAGVFPIPWDGKDVSGTPVPPGTYVCVLFSEDVPVKSVKVIKVRR